MNASDGRLTSEVRGFVGKEDRVLVIRRIEVAYRLEVDPARRELVERVHDMHAKYCPVARSIEGSIEISTRVEIVPPREEGE